MIKVKDIFIFIFCLTNINIYTQSLKDRCDLWRKQKDTITSSDMQLKHNHNMISKVDELCKMKIYLSSAFIMYESKRKTDSSLYFCNKAIELGNDIDEKEFLAEAYINRADTYLLNNKYESAEEDLSNARRILNNFFDDKRWIFYYQSYAELHDNKSDFHNSLKYIDSAITISKRINNDIELAVCYHNQGLSYFRLSKYEKAIQSLLLAIDLKENQQNPDGIARTYYLLGNCYVKWGQYKTALKYLKKSIPLAKKEGNDFLLILNYSYLVESFIETEEIDNALEFSNKAFELATKIKNNERIFQALIQKGWIYFNNLQQYDLAEQYFEKAYSTTNLINQEKNQYLFRCFHALINVYLIQEKYDDAKKFLKLYEETAKKLVVLDEIQQMHKTLSTYYEKTGQTGLALKHLKKYYKIKDSVSNQQVQTKVADLDKKYDTKKKELEIVTLNKEKDAQKLLAQQAQARQNWYLLATGVLLLFLGIGTWAFRKLQKQQKELKATNQVKNRLFSIISHDLRGMIIPFQRSGKILTYHIEKGNIEKTKELSQALEQNSERLSITLDNLLNWSLEQMNGYKMNPETIDVATDIKEIVAVYEAQSAYKKTNIELQYQEDIMISMDKGAFHVIFRNLIGNALKYTEEGSIRITFSHKDRLFLCSIIDTGVGMSKDQLEHLFSLEEKKSTIGTQGEKGTGLGLNLVYRFIQMHNGTIDVSSEKRIGTRFDLRIPITMILSTEKNSSESLSA
ncbi:hypothetical protein GCM10009430_17770 [Aquimarina litoralis]|uniref:histidine kinase n=1 Tax=Aquimarina litoralis TaxID=584605 RepID=A0ABP3TZC8_9FLAO